MVAQRSLSKNGEPLNPLRNISELRFLWEGPQ
jgi:hypothetical protein